MKNMTTFNELRRSENIFQSSMLDFSQSIKIRDQIDLVFSLFQIEWRRTSYFTNVRSLWINFLSWEKFNFFNSSEFQRIRSKIIWIHHEIFLNLWKKKLSICCFFLSMWRAPYRLSLRESKTNDRIERPAFLVIPLCIVINQQVVSLFRKLDKRKTKRNFSLRRVFWRSIKANELNQTSN